MCDVVNMHFLKTLWHFDENNDLESGKNWFIHSHEPLPVAGITNFASQVENVKEEGGGNSSSSTAAAATCPFTGTYPTTFYLLSLHFHHHQVKLQMLPPPPPTPPPALVPLLPSPWRMVTLLSRRKMIRKAFSHLRLALIPCFCFLQLSLFHSTQIYEVYM